MDDRLATLIARRDYLAGRADLKRSLGWAYDYDAREHDALAWAIQLIIVLATPDPP